MNYQYNLSFVTIHGSGHMVPQFRPRAALRLLRNLITGNDFAVPFVSDAQLQAMNDNDFNNYLDMYTVAAKASL